MLPSSTEGEGQLLLRALRPEFDGRSVIVWLRKSAPAAFRYVGQVRLLRQVWRWRGRPVPPFPFEAAVAGSGGLDLFPPPTKGKPDWEKPGLPDWETPAWPMLWDAAGFGDRSAIDLLEETKAVTAERLATVLFREDLARDPRALYYRFSVQALSRYAGLYISDPPEVYATESSVDDIERLNAWRRLLVPCRHEGVPKPPQVRFVVPLTQTEEDNPKAKVPGLLVVLDDAWFVSGGLAETLDAEVVPGADYWGTAGDKPENEKPPLMRPEFGPDPILTGRAWTKLGVGEAKPEDPEEVRIAVPDRALALDVVGPIGHTFDTNADAPLFNASSFIVRPPDIEGVPIADDDRSLAWYFAKLRFRRMAHAK